MWPFDLLMINSCDLRAPRALMTFQSGFSSFQGQMIKSSKNDKQKLKQIIWVSSFQGRQILSLYFFMIVGMFWDYIWMNWEGRWLLSWLLITNCVIILTIVMTMMINVTMIMMINDDHDHDDRHDDQRWPWSWWPYRAIFNVICSREGGEVISRSSLRLYIQGVFFHWPSLKSPS